MTMHLKYLLGSIVTVGYCIAVPHFYLVLQGLRCRESTIMDKPTYQSLIKIKVLIKVCYHCLINEIQLENHSMGIHRKSLR